MAKNNVRNDLIPMRAGIVKVTPLDVNGNPEYSKSVSTARNFLVSTAISNARTSESVANGNGQDAEFPLDETYTLAVSTNVFDPKFHAVVAGTTKSTVASRIIYDTTIVPKTGSSGEGTVEYTFAEGEKPVVGSDENLAEIELKDSYGNQMKQMPKETSATTLQDDEFTYDPSTGKLVLKGKYDNVALSAVYYIAGATGDGYETSSILKTNIFQIEVMGEMQSISTGEQTAYYAKLTRAAVSGDLPNVTTQKPLTNTITYNFKSMPVPKGISAFYESFTPIVEAPAAAAMAKTIKK